MTDLKEIIHKLEKAAGADRELDAIIAREVGWVALILPYTSSVDAALTLLPPGYFWLVSSGRVRSGEPLGGAQVRTPLSTVVSEAEHDSPVIALCIAALQAREKATA